MGGIVAPALFFVIEVEVVGACVADWERPGAFEALGGVDVVGDVGGAEGGGGGIGFAGVVVDALGFEGAGGGFGGPL